MLSNTTIQVICRESTNAETPCKEFNDFLLMKSQDPNWVLCSSRVDEHSHFNGDERSGVACSDMSKVVRGGVSQRKFYSPCGSFRSYVSCLSVSACFDVQHQVCQDTLNGSASIRLGPGG